MTSAGKVARRWLLLGHRWLGIGTGLFFALWIGSGLVMLYVPFPNFTRAERLAHLAPLAWDRVQVGPDTALAAAGNSPASTAISLEMCGDVPVYRLMGADGRRLTVSAMTGAIRAPIDGDEARRIAGGAHSETVWRDQWTVTARYDPLRPFHKVALGDGAGTELYVSAETGEIALDTTRWERGWNWVGAVTHWVYLTPLRARPEAWRQVVLWMSGIACATAFTGVAIGIWRVRLRRRYRGGSVSPYRGLALWHHGFGLLGGLSLVTFIASGWLSMNPNRWFSSLAPPEPILAAYAGRPGRINLQPADLAPLGGGILRQMRFVAIGGRWWVIRERDGGPDVASAGTATGHAQSGASQPDSLDAAAITAAAAHAVAGGHLVAVEPVSAYDAYWYPHGDERPLPVLRLSFDDPAATWLHVDPRDGTILNRLDRSGRINRWLFDAPHRLDLPGLVTRPAARDAVQWLLNALGAGIALTGLVAGGRRLARAKAQR